MRFSFLAPAALLAAGALALGETKTYFSADPAQQQLLWDDFKATFGRTYESRDDEAARFRIFVDNLKLIDERNAAEKAAGGHAEHGITRFSDLTEEEFKARYLLATPRENRVVDVKVPPLDALKSGVDVNWTGELTTPVYETEARYWVSLRANF